MRSKRIPAEEQYRLIMECRQSGMPASTGRTYRAPESQEIPNGTDPQLLAQTLRIVKELEC